MSRRFSSSRKQSRQVREHTGVSLSFYRFFPFPFPFRSLVFNHLSVFDSIDKGVPLHSWRMFLVRRDGHDTEGLRRGRLTLHFRDWVSRRPLHVHPSNESRFYFLFRNTHGIHTQYFLSFVYILHMCHYRGSVSFTNPLHKFLCTVLSCFLTGTCNEILCKFFFWSVVQFPGIVKRLEIICI